MEAVGLRVADGDRCVRGRLWLRVAGAAAELDPERPRLHARRRLSHSIRRSIDHVRYLFARLGVTVIPEMFPLGGADKVIGEDGGISDEKIRKSAESIGRTLVEAMLRG